MKNSGSLWFGFWIVICLTSSCLLSCKKTTDVVAPSTSSSANQLVDSWILSNMRELYYWNDKIPASSDTTLAPADFFASIKYTYDATTRPDGDRFSWIEQDATQLTAELSGQTTTTGMEFNLYLRSSNSTDVIAQVLYVLPGSPAAKAGLLRGDIISKVNGQSLNTTNYNTLLFNSTSFVFGMAQFQLLTGTLVDTDQTKSVTATVFQANPVLLDSIYTVGSKTVGYLVYNQFIPAPNGSKGTEYDDQLDAIFADFKAKNVNELVLDLRYNPGGYTSSSANLASLIGKGIDANKVYFREEWNATITPYLKKTYTDAFFVQNFLSKPQNIGDNLQRVFVLTTDWTASASELIINGLRPYMTVTTIGTTTVGKNVGSITITDDTGKIGWGIQPIVFRSYNSLGQSDYASGFAPSVEVEEPINLLPLGDTQEPLLNEALFEITGSRLARRAATVGNPLTHFRSSIQRKMGGGLMVKQLKTKAL